MSVRHVVLSERTEQDDYAGQALAMSKLLGRLADEIVAALAASAAAQG
jgi:hypothetical protein